MTVELVGELLPGNVGIRNDEGHEIDDIGFPAKGAAMTLDEIVKVVDPRVRITNLHYHWIWAGGDTFCNREAGRVVRLSTAMRWRRRLCPGCADTADRING